MDLLRLPSTLRRALLNTTSLATLLRRPHSTNTAPTSPETPSDPTNLPPQPQAPPTLLPHLPTLFNDTTLTPTPTRAQCKHATTFFTTHPPHLLYTTSTFRALPPSPHPEVAFVGRSNAGKSSLLNALFARSGDSVARVSKKAGRTRTMNGFGVTGGVALFAAPKSKERRKGSGRGDEDVRVQEKAGSDLWRRLPPGSLTVLDMPGYGAGSREEWGREILKFLRGRRQLKRVFVLVDAEHGLKASDVEMLRVLRGAGVSVQVLVCKCDKVLGSGSLRAEVVMERAVKLKIDMEGMRKVVNKETGGEGTSRAWAGDFLACSAERGYESNRAKKLGIEELRWAVLTACGLGEADATSKAKKGKQLRDEIKILDDDEDGNLHSTMDADPGHEPLPDSR